MATKQASCMPENLIRLGAARTTILEGVKGTGNRKSRYKTPNLRNKYVEKREFFQCQGPNLSQVGTKIVILSCKSTDRKTRK